VPGTGTNFMPRLLVHGSGVSFVSLALAGNDRLKNARIPAQKNRRRNRGDDFFIRSEGSRRQACGHPPGKSSADTNGGFCGGCPSLPHSKRTSLAFEEMVVFGMMSDPKPNQSLGSFHRDRAVMETYSCRPKATGFFEPDGGMAGVLLENLKILVRCCPDGFWQPLVAVPEIRRGEMFHRDVQRPASKSAFALAASLSRRPAKTSASICLSH